MVTFERLEPKIEGSQAIVPEFNLCRAKIPGGWMVVMFRSYDTGTERAASWGYGGMTFIPDPGHTWDGASINEVR
jgi:hypothetical protein